MTIVIHSLKVVSNLMHYMPYVTGNYFNWFYPVRVGDTVGDTVSETVGERLCLLF